MNDKSYLINQITAKIDTLNQALEILDYNKETERTEDLKVKLLSQVNDLLEQRGALCA